MIRSILLHYPKDWLFTSRGIEMDLLAKSLLAGHGLSSPFGGTTGPTAFIAPAYPLFVAAIFRVFGIDSTASAVTIMLLHTAANLVTIWLILHLAEKLFDRRVALLAGLFWALSPAVIYVPTIFWDTSFGIAFSLGLIAFVVHYKGRATPLVWIGLGTYSAIAALLNPALLLFLIATLVWLAIQQRTHIVRNVLLAAATFITVFSPWPIRNARAFHAFIPLRTTVGFELWMGNRDGATGYLDESVFPMFNLAELNDYVHFGEVAYTNQKSHLATDYIKSHPTTFAALTAKRILRYWTGTGTQHGSPVFALHSILTTVFGLAGLVLLHRKNRATALLFAIPLVLFPLPYYITHAEFRYRLLLDPILTVLAAYAIATLFRRYHTPTGSRA